MNLVRIIQQASILISMISTSLLFHIDLASAQQKTCVITDEGSIVCGKITTQTKKPNSNSTYRKEIDKIVFVLKGCKRYNSNIKCDFVITNKGTKEYGIVIYVGGSKIVDLTGKSHYASRIEFDGQNGRDYANTNLAPDVDYSAALNFEDVPDQVTQVQLLNIVTNTSTKSIQFRNISISNQLTI